MLICMQLTAAYLLYKLLYGINSREKELSCIIVSNFFTFLWDFRPLKLARWLNADEYKQ